MARQASKAAPNDSDSAQLPCNPSCNTKRQTEGARKRQGRQGTRSAYPVKLRPREQLAEAAAAEQHKVRGAARPQPAHAASLQAHRGRRDVRHRPRPGTVRPVQVPYAAALLRKRCMSFDGTIPGRAWRWASQHCSIAAPLRHKLGFMLCDPCPQTRYKDLHWGCGAQSQMPLAEPQSSRHLKHRVHPSHYHLARSFAWRAHLGKHLQHVEVAVGVELVARVVGGQRHRHAARRQLLQRRHAAPPRRAPCRVVTVLHI